MPPTSALGRQDTCLLESIRDGAELPQPLARARKFQITTVSPFMNKVIINLVHKRILSNGTIAAAYWCFVFSTPTGAARSIMDLSPPTLHYRFPLMRLCSAADVSFHEAYFFWLLSATHCRTP
jgi:hypothetical protein